MAGLSMRTACGEYVAHSFKLGKKLSRSPVRDNEEDCVIVDQLALSQHRSMHVQLSVSPQPGQLLLDYKHLIGTTPLRLSSLFPEHTLEYGQIFSLSFKATGVFDAYDQLHIVEARNTADYSKKTPIFDLP